MSDDRWPFVAVPLIVGGVFLIGLILTVGRSLYRELRYGPPPPPTATPRVQLEDPPGPIIPRNQYHGLNLPLAGTPDAPRIESTRRPGPGDRAPNVESDENDDET